MRKQPITIYFNILYNLFAKQTIKIDVVEIIKCLFRKEY